MAASGWDNFWKDQKRSFYAVMKIATSYFTRQLIKKQYVKPGDAIFDYGCGPGFVADDLAASQVSITGADINEFFIGECRKNHPSHTFIHITTDTATNANILQEQLAHKKFDRIILLSVAQYLKSTSDLHDIIQLLNSYVKDDGQIIIADVIDNNTSSARDALALFVQCIKKGRIGTFVGFISYLLFSNYREISRKTQLLKVPAKVIHEIADNLGLNCKEVPGLTLHPTRCNYVFYRPNR
jgi:2-polyprenyl-3-methyl-5-hydroxy-6-metoxy-1,4-benzoquinol methylase